MSRANICPILFCLFVWFTEICRPISFVVVTTRIAMRPFSLKKNQFVFYFRQTNSSLWLVIRRKFVTARGSSLLAGGDNPQTTNTKWWKFSSFVFFVPSKHFSTKIIRGSRERNVSSFSGKSLRKSESESKTGGWEQVTGVCRESRRPNNWTKSSLEPIGKYRASQANAAAAKRG